MDYTTFSFGSQVGGFPVFMYKGGELASFVLNADVNDDKKVDYGKLYQMNFVRFYLCGNFVLSCLHPD